MDSPAGDAFWRFSLRRYARPGVAPACLALQDEAGLDVNLLLLCVWIGQDHGRRLSPDEIDEAAALTRDWRREIVEALRAVRRRLKTGPPPAPDTATETLRDLVKKAELEAERLQQMRLAAWAGPPPPDVAPDPEAALANARLYAQRHGRAAPPGLLARIAQPS